MVEAPFMLRGIPGLTIMWLGILGGAITLFANLLAPRDMADWAWLIVDHWQDRAPAFWDLLAGPLGLEVPSLLVPPLNIAAFLLLTAVGVRIRDHRGQGPALLQVRLHHFVGGIIAVFVIGYIIVAGSSQSSSAEEGAPSVPLVIFLAAAAASFSPAIAGRGNLIKRLWFILAGLLILLALNKVTTLGLAILTPKDPS